MPSLEPWQHLEGRASSPTHPFFFFFFFWFLVFNGDRLGKLTTVQVALRGNQGHLSRGIVGMPDWGILHDLADRHQEALSPATGALLTPGGHFSPLGTSHRPGPGSVSPWVSDSRYHLLQGLH